MTESRRVAEAFPPGEYLREELDARGWTQADLAAILGRPERLINEIINAKRTITPETALGLSKALGTSAEMWMRLESAYRLFLAGDGNDEITKRAMLYDLAPVNEMMRRGWIEETKSADVLERQLLDFFDLERVTDEPTLWAHAARKSTTYKQ